MADSLSDIFSRSRIAGVQLTGKPRKELSQKTRIKGKKDQGKKITLREFKKGQSFFDKKGYPDYMSTVGRTYGANLLGGKVKSLFEKSGYKREGNRYITRGPLSESGLSAARAAGYSDEDIRAGIAQNFANDALSEQISKFMGEGGFYSRDPKTGAWSKKPNIGVNDTASLPPFAPVMPKPGAYEGIDPNSAPGFNPAEIAYAMNVDPYKIQAKSAERRALIEQANYLYNLIPSAFS